MLALEGFIAEGSNGPEGAATLTVGDYVFIFSSSAEFPQKPS